MPKTKRKKPAAKAPARGARAATGGTKPARGPGRPAGSGDPNRRAHRRRGDFDRTRITRHALARLMGVQPSLVTGYFARPGAPKLDKNLRLDKAEGEKFVREQAQWAVGGISAETKGLKDRKLALEVEAMEIEAGIRKGEILLKRDLEETIAALWVEHEARLRQKFEHELPPRYQGKNEVERRQINVNALAEIAAAFRNGQLKIQAQTIQEKAS